MKYKYKYLSADVELFKTDCPDISQFSDFVRQKLNITISVKFLHSYTTI
jgi:hypothetical protein